MKKFKQFLHSKFVGKRGRLFILIVIDALLIISSVLIVFYVLQNQPLYPLIIVIKWLIPSLIFLGLPFYIFSNQYQSLTRYVGSKSFYALASRNGILLIIIASISELFGLPRPSQSSWILIWITLSLLSAIFRFAARDILINFDNIYSSKIKRVAILGSGSAALQLAAALKVTGNYKIVCFIDNVPAMLGRTIWDIPIRSKRFIAKDPKLEEILLAEPNLSKEQTREIVEEAKKMNINVLKIPSIEEITNGKTSIDSLKPIMIEDLLGRDLITTKIESIRPHIEGKSICVTGGGGSIGTELCKQIMNLKPDKLIIIESNEPALYNTNQLLLENVPENVEIVAILGSAQNFLLLKGVFNKYKVKIVFHAAAYKHVPIVEKNPISGIYNNVFATQEVCKACIASGVKQMILISTDKAVRPENIMGASKRLAEVIIQGFAEEEREKQLKNPEYKMKLFSMVRFGNVLASSGSVVPLFKKQISNGGPITLTHRDIVRYFMTITEATQLVLNALTMAKGGDVFLLDMGEPIKISSLAEQMIQLSGLSIKNQNNPKGDIEIIEIGLRPGEKLFEELLIDAEATPTIHPLIFKGIEKSINPQELKDKLKKLKKYLKTNNSKMSLKTLSELVPEWKRI